MLAIGLAVVHLLHYASLVVIVVMFGVAVIDISVDGTLLHGNAYLTQMMMVNHHYREHQHQSGCPQGRE